VLVLVGGGLGWITEGVLKPAPRSVVAPGEKLAGRRRSGALDGAREVFSSRYLLCIVAYEFAAAVTDFVINVVFGRAFDSEVAIAQMYGRLGWIVSGTALFAQLVIVPRLLPFKRVALLVPPAIMVGATLAPALFPVVAMAIVLAASDRGLNYSLQQVAKESLYVPLNDVQKYKAKAFIDVVIDRGGKALSSVALLIIIAKQGVSIASCFALALAALVVWAFAANVLGRAFATFTVAAARRRRDSSLSASSGGDVPAAPPAALPEAASPRT
jgi:AAA family ATP:ADP antiporter